jgi:uncharacterized RDD family membrane protein YckC
LHNDPRSAIGPSIGAAIIDLVLFVALAATSGGIRSGTAHAGGSTSTSASIQLNNGVFVLFLVLSLAYYTIGEGLTWRTLGKQLLGVHVVKLSGEQCSWSDAVLRNVLRVIDGFPVFYLVGFIVLLASVRSQRVGDHAADTIVIRGR